jgi:tol-pal system-associated acyl-CoA thioesterase
VNYLKFIERARTEFMRSLGHDRGAIFNEELMFVVRRVAVDYRAPARLDDALQATVRLLRVGGASLLMEQCVRRDDETLMEAEVELACVDPSGVAPRRIPRDWLGTLRAALALAPDGA